LGIAKKILATAKFESREAANRSREGQVLVPPAQRPVRSTGTPRQTIIIKNTFFRIIVTDFPEKDFRPLF